MPRSAGCDEARAIRRRIDRHHWVWRASAHRTPPLRRACKYLGTALAPTVLDDAFAVRGRIPSCWLLVLAAAPLVAASVTAENPFAPIVLRDDTVIDQADGDLEPLATSRQPWFGKRLAIDLGSVLTSPLHWEMRDWQWAGGAALATVATGVLLDRRVQAASQANRSAGLDRWSHDIGQFGTLAPTTAIVAIAGVTGWLTSDDRLRDASVDAAESVLIASGVITPLLKLTAGRGRPNKSGADNDAFALFGGDKSFPSGHATHAFAIASTYAFSYPDEPWVGALAFSAATAVGLSRVNDNKHYLSDVLAGAIIGTAVGCTVVRLNHARRHGEEAPSRWQPTHIGLTAAPGTQAVTLEWNW